MTQSVCSVYARVSSAKTFPSLSGDKQACAEDEAVSEQSWQKLVVLYLHQLSPTSRGCSIWKRWSLTLPVSVGTRSAPWSTSACFRSTWLDADERIRGKNEKQTTTEGMREDEFNESRIAFLTSDCAFMSLHALRVSELRLDYWQNNSFNKH